MSTKAMARLYTGHSSGGGGMGGGSEDNIGMFGGISGGVQLNPTTGKYEYTPYHGTGGPFGGKARGLAARMDAQMGGQLMGGQMDKEMQQIQNEHEAAIAKLHNDAIQKLAETKNVQDIAAHYGVTPEQYAGKIMEQVTSNSLQTQALKGNSLAKPEAQASSDTGTNFELSGINPNTPRTAAAGGISAYPMPTGGMASVAGATPRQSTTPNLIFDPKTKQQIQVGTKTIQDNTPARMSTPVDKFQYDQASQLNPTPDGATPSSGMSMPNPTPNFPAGASMVGGMLSTDSPPNPGLPQDMPPAGPMGLNPMPNGQQPQDRSQGGFYNPQEIQQSQGFNDWLNQLMQNFQSQGQQFQPSSLTGAL